ncbi:MAG: nucleotidyltransferase domain-containing protein [Solobacterium sp.]|nr:nucleotidyltransferase domain-containing protein [Solobacterium sp.]
MIEKIRKEIEEIENTYSVKILLAIESGSRAWGFASPDSDYDVRFIYARRKEEYLRLDPAEDHIEWKLDEVLDVNGWDVQKVLMQIHRGNPTLFEWIHSPIVYKKENNWVKAENALDAYFDPRKAVYHYRGLAKRTYLEYLQEEKVTYKKYLYALRSLFACLYIEKYQAIPPVQFHALCQSVLPSELKKDVDMLLEKKKEVKEKDLQDPLPSIQNFITEELVHQEEAVKVMTCPKERDWEELNSIFLELITFGV